MLSAAHVNPPIKALLHTFIQVDDAAIASVPMHGPLILATNHINWLDAPVGFSHMHPRPLTAFVKVETWDNFMMRVLFNAWDAIPINREEIDSSAFKRGEEALKEGKIIAIAPEGTRSSNGRLNIGHPGIVVLALRAGVPILPVVFYGNEQYKNNLKNLRRTPMIMRAGEPFTLKKVAGTPDKLLRRQMTDAIMYELSRLLPAEYRGKYSAIEPSYRQYLDFINPVAENFIEESG